jgi:hypothetical protein
MNDFEAGARLEHAGRPFGLPDDVAIELYGDAAGIQTQGCKQALDGLPLRNLAAVAVEVDSHSRPGI